MSLLRVPIYPTRNLAVEIDPGARSIVAGTNVSFTTNADGSITINASSGTGTVTSVGATGSTGLTVGGSPITTSGTLTFTLSANLQSWSGIAPATKADLASPVFTGDPRAPTPATADNDTSIATTAFVKNQGYATTTALGSYVLKAGDTMSGTLVNTAGIGFDFQRPSGRMLVRDNGSGQPTIDFVNPANTAFTTFRSSADGWIFNSTGGSFDLINGNLRVAGGDIYTWRAGGTTGVIFLRSDATRYLFYDGGKYVMPGAGLDVGGTIQSGTRAITGLIGGEGFQMMWNTVQSGQGRTEFVNNRGGDGGGFTWWDRANTGAGTGTALAALTGAGLFVNEVLQFNTGGVSVGQLRAWPGNSSYVAFGNTAMSSTEYAVLTASPSVDSTTYISSAAGGSVRIRPSANSTVGEAVFSTSGLALAKYVWPDANTAGSKKLSRISIGTAAPSGLIDGELYLRY